VFTKLAYRLILAIGEEYHGTACGQQLGRGFDGERWHRDAGALWGLVVDSEAHGGGLSVKSCSRVMLYLWMTANWNHPGCC
jgi:hypothetical protein